jgi:hypothetical protein
MSSLFIFAESLNTASGPHVQRSRFLTSRSEQMDKNNLLTMRGVRNGVLWGKQTG